MSPQNSPTSPTAPSPRPPRGNWRKWAKRAGITLLVLALLVGGMSLLLRMLNKPGGIVLSQSSSSAASQFDTLTIPLSELAKAGQISVDQSRTLNINGQLKVNNSFIVSPSSRPTSAVAGQIYYDQGSNQLAYYNGSEFVNLNGSNTVVNNISGITGSITLGDGLAQAGNTISNSGVLSVQGESGAVTFTGGPGVVVDGTTISSSGVLSFGGVAGDITVGPGLAMSGNELRNDGIISVTSDSSTLTVTDDGNGNITLNSSGAGTGTVQSPGGTAGRIAMFTGVQTIEDSLLSQSGGTITVNGDLSVTGATTLGTPLAVTSGGTGANNAAGARTNLGAAASGANNDITSLSGLTTALSVSQGGTGVGTLATNGVLLGNGTSPITSVVAGGTGLCLISTAGAPSWQACPGGDGGVLSLNGLTGNLTLANASASGSIITVNDASTSQKGIVQLNGTNFSVSGGVANTIQDIAITSTPTFAGINTNSINPSAALTVGATSQNLTLQGANTTITSTNGANVATLTFVAPTANVTYRLQTAAAGTYDVCTTAGNCVGTGGSVSTSGGTTNTLAKFTGTNSIGDSLITDNGTVVTVGGDLTVTGTVTLTTPLAITSGGTGAIDAANARVNLGAAASGANSDITSISGLTTALSLTQGGTGATSLTANGVLLGNGTSPISSLVAGASGQCLVSTGGAPVWQTCPGSGGVASVNGLTGALTIANATAAGSTITLNDASTSQKGIAQFNGTNFSVSSGVVNTIQDIATTSAPTFGQLTVTSAQATANMVTINNTNGSATGNLLDLQLAGSSKFAVNPAGALTLSSTINGQTISSSANFTGTLAVAGAANLNGGATVTGTLTANTITPTGALTVGATGQSFVLQGNAGSTITSTNSGNTTTLAFQAPTANVTYRFLTASAGTYDVCTTVGNCTGVGGGVTTSGGTTNRIAKFTAGQTIGDSIISDDGTTVSIGGTLAVNTITPTAALTVGSTAQDLTLQGATVALTSTSGAITNTLTFATPSGSNKTITVPNASGTIAVSASGPLVLDASGNLTCPTCSTGSSVNSLNGLTGALTIANASGSGSTITINDASTSQKGIAQFNSTNFTASSGVINTIQNINTAAAPTFGQLTITSGQASAAMITANNTNVSATGNLLDLQLNGSSRFAVSPAGALTLSSTVNGQTISSAASFTGALAVAGAANLNGGATVTGTLTANTITPSGSLTVGATSQSFLLQGNASSTITATNGANTTSVAFQSPTANVTYRFLTTAAGTYDICTTAGNCAGVGGGVTTPGGTVNTIAKFTASGTIADSIITDNGSTVTIGGALAVNTITPSAALTVGSTAQDLTLQGANVSLTSTASGITNAVVFATPSGSNKTVTIPNASGTLAVSASGPLVLDAAGNISCPTCTTSGGGAGGAVDSLNGLNGTLTITNASGSGSTITIDDASTSQKGIAQFNSTNFSVSGGVVNTIQDIAISAAPTFGRLTVTSSQASNAMFLINNTNAGASGNLLDVQLNGSSRLAVTPAGNMTLTGTINGQTISSAANLTGTLAVAGAANLNGGATVTGTLTANTITPSGALTVGATSQSFLVQGSSASTITATSGASTTTLAFQAPTASVTYRFLTAATGTYDVCTTAGNCTGVGGGVTTAGGTAGKIAKFTSTQGIGDSIITDNGSTVTIGGTLAVNTLTPTAALTVGSTAQDLTLQGANVNLTSTASGITNSLVFATPSGSNKTIIIPNASGTLVVSASGPLAIDAAGNITCATCSTGANVSSLNGLTGALTIANASGSGSTVTINDASTSQKGIAQFNSTNFSASSGTINTIQNINTTAAPTFGQLTLSSSQASAAMLTINNTNAAGTGNLIDLQLNGSSKFAVSPAGALTLSSTINGQTISSSANFTGTLAVASTANLNGGATVTGTLTANTITPSSSLTVGATSQSFVLQGNSSSTITATSGASTTTVAFQTPTANVTYRFLTAAAGTYDICTTVGNCASVAGGVTTSGGTTNKISKFTGSQTIGDSIITDNGSTVTIGGTLAVNTITPSAALTVGATGQNLTLQGATVNLTSTSGGITNALTFATPATSNKTITLPDETGTVCLQNSANCGFALASGSSGYIQNQNAGQQASSNFWISGIGRADTALQTPLLDAATATTLNIGNTNATAINLNQSTTIAASRTLTVTSGATTLTGANTGNALVVSNASSTGSIAIFRDNATDVVTIADGGAVTLQNAANSSAAFRVRNAAGSVDVISVSTSSPMLRVSAANGDADLTSGTGAIQIGADNTDNLAIDDNEIIARNNGGTSTLFLQGNGGGLTVGANLALFKNNTNATNAFRVQNAAGTTDVFDVDTVNARVGIGTNAPGTALEVSAGLLAAGTGFNFNIMATDTATAAQNVGGGIGFAGNADTQRTFSAIQGFHESATATDYAGGLRFLTRASGATTLTEQARIGSTGQAIFKNSSNSTTAFRVQNAAGNEIFTADTSAGRILLGKASTLAGALAFSNATNSNTATISSGTPTANRTITLPDETGTVCLQNSANCGFALASGSSGYIQNQSSADQTADFRISGTGRATTALQAPSFDVPSAGTLAIGGANATAINIANNAASHTINIATASGAAQTVTIGSTNATSTTAIQGNSVALDTTTSGSITIGTANQQNIFIGDAGSVTNTIHVGANAGSTSTVNVGSTGAASTTLIQGGTGGSAVSVQAGSGGSILVGTSNSNTITVGNASTTATLTLGQSTASNTINIGNGAIANGNTQTINIGTQFAAGSGRAGITIGNTNGASALFLQAGTGGLTLATNSDSAAIVAKSFTDGTGAFQIQRSSGASLFVADTSNARIQIGSATADSTGILLVLDTKNTSGDPTGVDGAMYYNSSLKTFRCYVNGAWQSCSNGLVYSQTASGGTHEIFNTTTETAFPESYTIPANACQPGRTFRVKAAGYYTTSGSPGLTMKAKLGSTTVGTIAIPAMPASASTLGWNMEVNFVCYATNPSASGQVNVNGLFEYTSSNSGGSTRAGGGFPNSSTAVGDVNYFTINTTASQAITISAQWTAASAAIGIGINQFTVETLGP